MLISQGGADLKQAACIFISSLLMSALLPVPVFSAEESLEIEAGAEAQASVGTEAVLEADPAAARNEPVRAVSHNVSIKIEADRIFPQKVQVDPGTTIVWVNNTEGAIKVRFISTAVSTTCKAPRAFVIGPAGIFVSEKIRSGGVASLCFLEPNEYSYEVDFLDGSGSGSSQAAQTLPGEVLVGS